jgi:hypothetical protein
MENLENKKMSNSTKRTIFYWIGLIIQFISSIGIIDSANTGDSRYLLISMIFLSLSGGIVFAVTLGKSRKVQKFFGHDLKKECECPPTKLVKMPEIKKSSKDKDALG